MKKFLGVGAEAKLYVEDGIIIKERVKKGYRVIEIDERIRKQRTKAEAKILKKAFDLGVKVPKVEMVDTFLIKIEYIDGKRLKDVVDSKNAVFFAEKLGTMIGKLHNNDIIHGDITTSNMIVKDDELYLIDFGLGYISKSVEDRAVDLHLLECALISTHQKLKDKFFDAFCDSYAREYKESRMIFGRLDAIRQRGRYVTK